jgi:hypothetical protein
MTQKKRDFADPLEQAATLGTIGGKKEQPPQPERSEVQTSKIPEAQKSDRKQHTVYLPPYLSKWLKVYAVEHDQEISEVVTEALERFRGLQQ